MSDAAKLTLKLMQAGATKAKVTAIIDGYGDPIDWSSDSLEQIIGTVWDSDLNSGDEPDGWIINEILTEFNLEEVQE